MKKLFFLLIMPFSVAFMPSLFGMQSHRALLSNLLLSSKNQYRLATQQVASLNLSQIEPDVLLKSPLRVLDEIQRYWIESKSTDCYCQVTNDSEGYNNYVNRARVLLTDALVASHMVNQIKSTNYEIRLKNHHEFMRAWYKEQMHFYIKMPYHIDDETYDVNQRLIWSDMGGWDIRVTQECQEQLVHEIRQLRQHLTYVKDRVERDIKNKNKNNE